LLEKLQKHEKALGRENPGELFDFELETRTQCSECKGVRYLKNKANQLTLTAPVSSKVEKGTPVELSACLERFFGEESIADFNCPKCNKKTNCLKRQRLVSFPKVLLCVLTRFVFDEWVPKKLEIELQVPTDRHIDFELYRGDGTIKEGEEELPNDEGSA
jgi:ubiquitin carboxyl-terminal hydrolase 5/13